MNKYLIWISVLLISFALIAGVNAYPNANTQNVDLKVKVNKNFNIKLISNPTTGYSWKANYDPNYIKLVKSSYVPGKTQICGSGGKEIYIFKGIKKGTTEIVMQYYRPWENKPINEVKYTVTIK